KTGMFNEDIRSADFNFTIRLAYHYDAVVLYEPLAVRLAHPANRSTQFNIANYFDYLTTFEALFSENKIERSSLNYARWNTHFKVGEIYRQKGQKKSAVKNYLAALQYKPLHFPTYKKIAGALVS
ncbi:MAG: hypothetical protein K0Q66_1884, partial [Chitinophagaceae bacterium]|nr:hypothetical protein [Chitinophagaceae bacterium]